MRQINEADTFAAALATVAIPVSAEPSYKPNFYHELQNIGLD
jgi:hypothetical protein